MYWTEAGRALPDLTTLMVLFGASVVGIGMLLWIMWLRHRP